MKRAAAAVALAVMCAGAARAGERPAIGLTLNASIGTHEEATGRQNVPLLPIPLLDVRVPFKRFEFEIEGVPSIGPVGYNSGIAAASRTTRISYGFGTLRYRIPGTRWSAGVGAILYNQESITSQAVTGSCGPPPCNPPSTIVTEDDRSRVGGMRYEIGYGVQLSERRSLSLQAGVTPVMHATVHEFISSFNRTFEAPERASQIDAQLRYAVRTSAIIWAYGIRYINYLAHFKSNGALSDRNTLLMPFAGVAVPLGR
ncbi:MAG TPA: hypothetical protein VFW34_12130 [Candidatus Rubrimentiphilum sp.]|nr:hypothetical protein [Candidatus Rubrimentiphilum sp.]